MEKLGIDPSTSRMLSERSTIWATSPIYCCRVWSGFYSQFHVSCTRDFKTTIPTQEPGSSPDKSFSLIDLSVHPSSIYSPKSFSSVVSPISVYIIYYLFLLCRFPIFNIFSFYVIYEHCKKKWVSTLWYPVDNLLITYWFSGCY